MASINGEQSSELLQAQAHVWNYMLNYINSLSLRTAIQLGIPDIIHKHGVPMTLEQLVDAIPNFNKAKTHGVRRLMRILTHAGLFAEEKVSSINEGSIGYKLTPAGQFLVKDGPYCLAPFIQAMLDPGLTKAWEHASEWFQNDRTTPFETANGTSLWGYTGSNSTFNQLFNDAMANDSRLVTEAVIRDCKHVFEGLNSIVDVAGGTGLLARAIADAFPNMKCTVLDLPHVANLEGTKNLSFVVGDMFESIPSADAILLKWTMHGWSNEECVKILKKCKEAIPSKEKGGKVIIIDMVVDTKSREHNGAETQLLFDMLLMVNTVGGERDENEWAKLFHEAGFNHYKINPILGLRSVIEVYP